MFYNIKLNMISIKIYYKKLGSPHKNLRILSKLKMCCGTLVHGDSANLQCKFVILIAYLHMKINHLENVFEGPFRTSWVIKLICVEQNWKIVAFC